MAPSHLRRRIAMLAPSRSPIGQPFAGGLEAHVWTLTRALQHRGHQVTLFAAPHSDPSLNVTELNMRTSWLSLDARKDVSMQPEVVVAEHHAYVSVMKALASSDEFDIVHNHSLHYLPVAMAGLLRIPMITTLHTPPTPWLESAIRIAREDAPQLVAVSARTARAWRGVATDVAVVHNGVDTGLWSAGPGGPAAVWSGRLVPEKAVHLAIDAATQAGVALDIAGPVVDPGYFAECVAPRLGPGVRYLGHLDQHALSEVVRHSAVALVTPEWDEPYGLVVAEALACGTPVAAFARGGIPEVVDDSCARLVKPGDVPALAAAIRVAMTLDRDAARRRATSHCSVTAMVRGYEQLIAHLTPAHRG